MAIKVFELFSGMGGASFALKAAGIDHTIVGHSDIDKWASKLYTQNHGDIKNWGDITRIDPNDLPDFDLLTGGTPCQDFSTAGSQKGLFDENGNPTRSGLIFEYVKILKIKQPKYFLWENVKGVLSMKDPDTGKYIFDYILELFSDAGYNIDFKIMDARDYGSPQMRKRVFVIGVCDDGKE